MDNFGFVFVYAIIFVIILGFYAFSKHDHNNIEVLWPEIEPFRNISLAACFAMVLALVATTTLDHDFHWLYDYFNVLRLFHFMMAGVLFGVLLWLFRPKALSDKIPNKFLTYWNIGFDFGISIWGLVSISDLLIVTPIAWLFFTDPYVPY